jgi:fructose-1,6-bisphosphatase/inositol monophosphatase family enzyme
MRPIDHDTVVDIIREAAEACIMPLWKNLASEQVSEKGLGDVVTEADEACEEFLASRLRKLIPRSLVVGEEGVAADVSVLGALETDQPVWVIDPLDGTKNFARQSGPFAVMVCLLLCGETLAAWIYDPVADTLLAAEQGAGAFLGRERISLGESHKSLGEMSGAVMIRHLPDDLREHALSVRDAFANASGSGCAAFDYREFVSGNVDFLFYYRTLVWDHAPGVLIVEEAGGHARRYSGEPYQPTDQDAGLLVASDQGSWRRLQETLLPGT